MKRASTGWPRKHIYIHIYTYIYTYIYIYIYIYIFWIYCIDLYSVNTLNNNTHTHIYIYICHLYPLLCISHLSFGHIRILLPHAGSHKASRAACGASGAQRNCRVKKRPIFLRSVGLMSAKIVRQFLWVFFLIILFLQSLSDYHYTTIVNSRIIWLHYFIVTIFVLYCNWVVIISSTLR